MTSHPVPVRKDPRAPEVLCTLTCPMPNIAGLIGGKWKLTILQILIFDGTKRFGELKRRIDGVTQTMLTQQLRALERDGLVARRVHAEVPPRVEYTATPLGRDLQDVFFAMRDWWKRNHPEIDDRVDGRDEKPS